MSEKSYFNELQRALARPDIDELRQHLDTYHRHTGKDADWPDEADAHMEAVMCAHWGDPEIALAYVVLAMAEYDEPDFLGSMSAGLLEDLLRQPTREFLDRIITEARKTARFRWMLSIPYPHAMPDWVWERVKEFVLEDVDNVPLPPRPVA